MLHQFILSLFLISVSTTAFAKEKTPKKAVSVKQVKDVKKHSHKNHKKHNHKDSPAKVIKKKDRLIVRVKGMVCAFCAQGIEKHFNKQKEVKKTKVDLDKMEVIVDLKPGKTLPEKVLKKIVTDAGFKYEGVK